MSDVSSLLCASVNYAETINYLFTRLPMYSRIGKDAFKKDLTNTLRLCEALGNPHTKFKSIHVGGTNGKGSVSHMLASVFQAAGYKTGLYTSPHLYDFRERIRINGEKVDEQFVIGFTQQIIPLIEEIQPSFFEITVAMAFSYFAEAKVDIAIIEVGLGGRLDSTNIITPELSVITNIGYDHMDMLGNTLEKIAFEKAGIIKPDMPVVIGERNSETTYVFEKIAAEKNAAIHFAEDHFCPVLCEWNHLMKVQFEDVAQNTIFEIESDLPGIYQQKNIATVLTALQILESHFNLQTSIKKGLRSVTSTTGLQGRWQVIRHNPTVVIDVAHNKEGIQQLIEQIKQMQYSKLHLVIGMVKEKDAASVLQLLPSNATYYFTHAHIPRALPADALSMEAARYHLVGNAYQHVNEALRSALCAAGADDLIIVCGSIFLVAELDVQNFSSPRRDKA